MTLEVVPAWQFLTRAPEAGGYTEQIALFPEHFFRNTRVNYARRGSLADSRISSERLPGLRIERSCQLQAVIFLELTQRSPRLGT